MRTIAIVLSRYTDPLSRLVGMINNCGFTHVSLSLDGSTDMLYSFNLKGFARESADKFRRHGVTLVKCYHLHISDRAHERLTQRIAQFEAHRQEYSYALLGVICCFLRIPYRAQKRYFCSQFVAECLREAHAVALRRPPALCLPGHLIREISRSLQLHHVQFTAL